MAGGAIDITAVSIGAFACRAFGVVIQELRVPLAPPGATGSASAYWAYFLRALEKPMASDLNSQA